VGDYSFLKAGADELRVLPGSTTCTGAVLLLSGDTGAAGDLPATQAAKKGCTNPTRGSGDATICRPQQLLRSAADHYLPTAGRGFEGGHAAF